MYTVKSELEYLNKYLDDIKGMMIEGDLLETANEVSKEDFKEYLEYLSDVLTVSLKVVNCSIDACY